MSTKALRIAGGAAVAALIGLQFIRPARTNPPSDPKASFEAVAHPSPEVAASLKRACNDCHSNETVWPWYSHIAPASWMVAHHVNDGRKHLNFSEWTRTEPDEVCEQVRKGKMPLRSYTLLHPQARLSEQETAAVCALESEGSEGS